MPPSSSGPRRRAPERPRTPARLISAVAIALASLVCCARCADMDVIIRDNQLHVRIHQQAHDRGFHCLYGLLGLLRRRRVPDVVASFTNVRDDFLDAADADAAPVFGFWRPPGAAAPLLWPDWDFWGWSWMWVAPLPLLAGQMAEEMVPWRHRSRRVYWKGTAWKRSLDGRHEAPRLAYTRCAAATPDLFAAEAFNWPFVLSHQSNFSAAGAALLKPVAMDLRRLMRHKFLIYLPGRTWSTSLKRLLLAGAVVLMPADNPHDSVVTQLLARCEGCVLRYDLLNMCASLTRVLQATSDDEAEAIAARLSAFVRESFTLEALERYMLEQLEGAAVAQAGRPWASAAVDETYARVDCAWLTARHREEMGPGLGWQVDEWFDEACEIKNTTYLRYIAL